MKKLLLALLALWAVPALGADLPTKAKPFAAVAATPIPTCTAAACTGWHVDANIGGSGMGVNVLNLGTLNANGQFLGLGGGYQYWDGQYWLGAKVNVSYNVSGAGDITGTQSDRLFAFEGIEAGGNLFGLFGQAPPQPPAGQQGILSMLTSGIPTAEVGACQRGGMVGYCAGATLHYFLQNTPLEIDLSYLNAQYTSTNLPAGITPTTDNMAWFSVRYHL